MHTRTLFSNNYIKGGLLVVAGLLLGWLVFHQAPAAKNEIQAETHEHEHPGEDEDAVWTCSMHPHIRMDKPGSCPICGMDLIPLQIQDNASADYAISMSESAMKLAQVQTSVVGKEYASKKISLFGRIQKDERLLQSQTAHVPGRIEQLLINVTGETVKKGQLIAKIYSPELINAQKELLEALSMRDKYPAVQEAVREKLRNWKLSDAQISQIEESGKINSSFNLYANTSGVVTSRNVNEGDYVSTGSVLFEVADLSRVWAVFDAYESDLPWISRGQRVEFTTQAVPGKVFEARVSFIDPMIDPGTRVARLRAELANTGYQLKPEMFINGNLKQNDKKKEEQLTIPNSAVLWTGTRSVVYVKIPGTDHPSFAMREVTLGASTENSRVILAGLSVGEEIVTNGAFSVDAASQLAGKASMMSPQGGEVPAGHNHGDRKAPKREEPGENDQIETDPEFSRQLTTVYKAYLSMKNAFFDSDAQKVKQTALQVRQNLDATDMTLLKGDAHNHWMEQLKVLQAKIGSISKLNDIDKQRYEFIGFNQAFYKSIKTFGLENVTAYYQYCPMANQDQGAFWFSSTAEIKNPYFGESMPECGETREVLKQ